MLLRTGQPCPGHRVQRACYVALRRKGWRLKSGVLAAVVAISDSREESVSACCFRHALDKCAALDAKETERAKKERKPYLVEVET